MSDSLKRRKLKPWYKRFIAFNNEFCRLTGINLFVIGGILGVVLSGIVWMLLTIHAIDKNVAVLDERTTNLQASISSLEAKDDALEKRIDGVQAQINDILVLSPGVYNPSQPFSNATTNQYSYIDAPVRDTEDLLSGETIILINSLTGTELSASEIAGQKLLLHIENDDFNSYFYGQINEDGKWDGNCIYNSYFQEDLAFITEAQYENGKLVHYRQVFPYTTTNLNNDVWAVSDRTVEADDVRAGETYYYFRSSEFEQQFETSNVTADDIISVEDFEAYLVEQNAKVEGYYYGKSQDGKFNDTTGTSYMAKYYEDGNIRTLYYGNFKDGQFDDQTGDAWEIVFSVADRCYYLYKGTFINGSSNSGDEPKELTQSDIDSFLDGKIFNCPLTGLQ